MLARLFIAILMLGIAIFAISPASADELRGYLKSFDYAARREM